MRNVLTCESTSKNSSQSYGGLWSKQTQKRVPSLSTENFQVGSPCLGVRVPLTLTGNSTTIDQAVIGLKAYKELDETAKQMWEDLDDIILRPRTDLRLASIPSVRISGVSTCMPCLLTSNTYSFQNTLSLGPALSDKTIKSLFDDLQSIIQYLIDNIPAEIVQPLASHMMPVLSTRILEVWLDTAVPSSLEDMVDYQKALAQVGDFASTLDSLKWPGADTLHDWVSSAPRIWLNKRRETTLDWTRNQLSLGMVL